jgi:threonine/homoserine/homoserine lactone efflux protein
MAFLVGVGLAGLFQTYPLTRTALEVVSVVYMLWLAWKIAHAAAPKDREVGVSPMTFLQAAAFQWVNPKAWAMATYAVTLYAPDRSLWAVALVAVIFGAINLPSVSLWTLIGQQLRRVLTDARRLTLFNWTMAGLLVLSLAPVLWH